MHHTATESSQLSKAAAQGIESVLSSEHVETLWKRHNHSQHGANAPLAVSEQLQQASEDIENHPDLLSFMLTVSEMGKNALTNSTSVEDQELRKELKGLHSYLETISHNIELPKRDKLPLNYQRTLKLLEYETAQKPFQPIRDFFETVKNAAKHTAQHIAHDATKHPKSFASLLVACGGLAALMNKNMSTSKDWMDPELVGFTGLEIGADNTADFVSPVSVEDLIGEKVGCHQHLESWFGQDGADYIMYDLNMEKYFPEDCGVFRTLEMEAQNKLLGGYNWVNERLGWFTEDPALAIADALPDTPMVQTFNEAAQNAAQHVYAFDSVENVVIHTLLAGSSFLLARKCAHLNAHEISHAYHKTHDFVYRTAVNTPLNYIFGAAATAQSIIANNGASVEALWMGIGGVLAGHLTHKAARAVNRVKNTRNIMIPAKEALAPFSDVRKIVSDVSTSVQSTAQKAKKGLISFKTKLVATFGAVATATAAAATELSGKLETIESQTLRMLIENTNDITANVVGHGFVYGSYALVNIPQDAFLHLIFGVAGGTAGLVYGAGERALGVEHNHHDEHEPPSCCGGHH